MGLENVILLFQFMIIICMAAFMILLCVGVLLFLCAIILGVIDEIKESYNYRKRRGEWERKINGDNN